MKSIPCLKKKTIARSHILESFVKNGEEIIG